MRATIAGSPRFSPDGKWIVFDSRQGQSQSDLFVTPAEGGLPKHLSNHPATDTVPRGRAMAGSSLSVRPQRLESGLEDARRRPRSAADRARQWVSSRSMSRWDSRLLFENDDGDGLWTADRTAAASGARPDTLPPRPRPRPNQVCPVSTARGLGGKPEILFYRLNDQTTSSVLRLPRTVRLGLSLAPDDPGSSFSARRLRSDLMMIDGFSSGR